MDELFFLGSGGGRIVMTTQMRATGGFRLNTRNFRVHVDPGPGALARCREFRQNSQNLDCIIATHGHSDHCTDLNVMVEAMCLGSEHKQTTVLASDSLINGADDFIPILSKYHKSLPTNLQVFKPGDSITLKKDNAELELSAVKAEHTDPTTFGVRFNIKELGTIVSYTSDTAYFDGLADLHKGSDILILNVTRPRNDRIPGHLCSDDTVKFLKQAKPKLALLSHLGMKMLRAGPQNEARYIETKSGVRSLAARDGLRVSLHEAEQVTLKEF